MQHYTAARLFLPPLITRRLFLRIFCLFSALSFVRRRFSTLKKETVSCAKNPAAASATTVVNDIPLIAARQRNVANAARTVNVLAIYIFVCFVIIITFNNHLQLLVVSLVKSYHNQKLLSTIFLTFFVKITTFSCLQTVFLIV